MRRNGIKRPKMRMVSKGYVDYVVQDCPILGKKVVRHYLETKKLEEK